MYVFLTPRGKALRKALVPLAERVNQVAVQGLKQADVDTTRRTLLVMLDNLIAEFGVEAGGLED
jgi:hypothetical protein